MSADIFQKDIFYATVPHKPVVFLVINVLMPLRADLLLQFRCPHLQCRSGTGTLLEICLFTCGSAFTRFAHHFKCNIMCCSLNSYSDGSLRCRFCFFRSAIFDPLISFLWGNCSNPEWFFTDDVSVTAWSFVDKDVLEKQSRDINRKKNQLSLRFFSY